jgi:hypothetical protein
MSASHTGRKLSEETKNKIRVSQKRYMKSKYNRENVSIYMSNRLISEDTKMKLSIAHTKKINVYDTFNEFDYIYNSVSEAADVLKLHKGTLSNAKDRDILISKRYYIESV